MDFSSDGSSYHDDIGMNDSAQAVLRNAAANGTSAAGGLAAGVDPANTATDVLGLRQLSGFFLSRSVDSSAPLVANAPDPFTDLAISASATAMAAALTALNLSTSFSLLLFAACPHAWLMLRRARHVSVEAVSLTQLQRPVTQPMLELYRDFFVSSVPALDLTSFAHAPAGGLA